MPAAPLLLALLLQSSTGLEEIRKLISAGKLTEAASALSAIPGENTETARLRGLIHLRLREYPEAIRALDYAASNTPSGSEAQREALTLMAQSYFLAAKMADAVPVLEKAIAAGVRTNEVFYMLAIANVQTQNPAKALQATAGLFDVAPGSAAAHLLTAQMMVRHEFEDAAIVQLRRALELDPGLPGAHYLLGVIAVYRGDFSKGIEEFRLELAINPNSAMAYYKMGDAWTRKEDWPNAVAFLQRAVWLNPDFSGPYILLGKAYLKLNDYSNAEGMLRQAIRMDPQNYSAHYLLGRTLMQAGNKDEGRKILEKSQQLRRDGVE